MRKRLCDHLVYLTKDLDSKLVSIDTNAKVHPYSRLQEAAVRVGHGQGLLRSV